MKGFILFIASFLFFNLQVVGQQGETSGSRFYLHSMADTVSNPAYKPYIRSWVNFLYEEDNSIRKTYWDPEDIKRYNSDYALFYRSLFQYPTKELLGYFKPYILSVYFDHEMCHITTAFWNFKFTPSDSSALLNQNPFAIVEVGAIQKEGKIYFTNLLEKRTSSWQKITSGKINYKIEPFIQPDFAEMKKANEFIDSLSKLFEINTDTFTYIVCRTPQTLGYISGFNFSFAGSTTGKTFVEAKTIISGRETFNYPHELTHMVLNGYLKTRGFFDEGLATFFGGSSDKSYKQCVMDFKKKYTRISDAEFKEIIKYPNSPTCYTLAALVVEIIYKKYGVAGIKKLSANPGLADEFLPFCQEKLGMDTHTLFKEINSSISH